MSRNEDRPIPDLDRVFHEPSRLAILTVLCGSPAGLAFSELKDECGLTDGNLNRHLRTLQEAGVVVVHKGFVGSRPRTTIVMTDSGRQQFVRYLQSLEETVQRALRATVEAEHRAGNALAQVQMREATGGGR